MEGRRRLGRIVGIGLVASVVLMSGCVLFQPRTFVDFEADPVTGMTPHRVDFNPVAEEAVTSYEWDFGDGGISDEPTPSHIYRSAGTYTVSLSVSLADGRAVDVVKEDLIEVALRVAKEEPPGPLVWLNRNQGKIYSGSRGGGEISTVVSSINRPGDIAVADGVVYWTAYYRVERADLDGGSRTSIYYDGGMFPTGIAVDSVAGFVYWVWPPGYVDQEAEIWKSSLDGSDPELWVTRERWAARGYGPRLIAIDSVNRRLYWYEMYLPYDGPIYPASLPDDGSPPEGSVHWTSLDAFRGHKIEGGLPDARGLALDVGLDSGARTVYWTAPLYGQVTRCRFGDGWTSRGTAALADGPRGVAVDAYEGRIYWSDAEGIHRANLSDGSEEELIYPGVQADALALDL